MKLFHGTSKSLLPSIMVEGIKPHQHLTDWPTSPSVCCYDSLDKAITVAEQFADGIVLEFKSHCRRTSDDLQFHPDYGCGPEFDTIHYMKQVSPDFIKYHEIYCPNVGYEYEGVRYIRPAGSIMRQWKSNIHGIVVS